MNHQTTVSYKDYVAGPLKDHVREFASGLLVPAELLLEANSTQQIFFGFDEVWFFPSDPSEPKPDSAWLVGPARVGQPLGIPSSSQNQLFPSARRAN